jgi:arsenite-transporting ATPase
VLGPLPSRESPPAEPFGFLDDDNIRLWLVGGKGGVGKTTIAAGLSLHLANKFPGRRYLAVSTGPSHSLSDVFAFPLSWTPKPVGGAANLFAVELDAPKLFSDFKARHAGALRMILTRGTYLDEEDISRFLELSFPGLDELMAMIQTIDLLASGQYDALIVDTAATGHTLRLLSLPALSAIWVAMLDRMMEKHRFISRVYARGYRKDEADEFIEALGRDISRLAGILQDRRHCRFVVVTLPEPVVIAETERLLTGLADKGISVGSLVVNQLVPGVDGCALCGSRRRAEQACLQRWLAGHATSAVAVFPAGLKQIQGAARIRAFLSQARAYTVSTAEHAASPQGFLPRRQLVSWIPHPKPGLEFFLFCGKGGVGKTTLSCAFALQLSRRFENKRILLFSTDPAHSLSDCLAQRIGPQETKVDGTANLFAVEIDPDTLFRDWKRAYSREIEDILEGFSGRMGLDVQFDREVLTGLLDLTPPGLDELMCLSELARLVERHSYDLYVLDTAPAGHTLRFLELFTVVRDWLRTFFEILLKYRDVMRLPKVSATLVDMSQRVKKLQRMLTDPARCVAIPVTIPDQAARDETARVLTALKHSGIPFRTLLVNQVIAPLAGCAYCASAAAEHEQQLNRYRSTFPDLDLIVLPRRFEEPRGISALMGLLRFTAPSTELPVEAESAALEELVT